MQHLDLFSGIGGFALAASWVWGEDHNIHSFVEIDPFCQKVLKKHWPDTPIILNIKEYKHDGTTIDLLTGGFPCQPFSVAGEQRGKKDDRYLWPEMLRIISEIHPTWIVGENVTGIINMGLDKVLFDLESKGYKCQTFLIPACAVNAKHKRNRIWIVANTNSVGRKIYKQSEFRRSLQGNRVDISKHLRQETIPDFLRRDNGISSELDKDRIKALGNAIVPQCVVPIMQAIKELQSNVTNH